MAYFNLARKAKDIMSSSYRNCLSIRSVDIFAPLYSLFKIHSPKFVRHQCTTGVTKCLQRTFRPFPHAKPVSSSSNNFCSRAYILWAFSFPFFAGLSEEEKKEEEDEIVMMMKYAILASQRGEHAKAEQLLHVALKSAQEMSDQNAITYIYDLMANLALENGEYKKAETLFVDVMKRSLQNGKPEDDNSIVEISLKLAKIYTHLENFDKAAQGYQFCIGTQENKLKVEGEENVDEDTLVLWAMSHDWYAKFLLHMGHYDRAKEHFLRAYDVCVKVKGLEHPQTAVLLNDLGSVCSLSQKYDEAIKYLREAIRVGNLCESQDLASFYVNLGSIYMQKKVFEKAEKYCQKGMKVAKAQKNEEAVEESTLCLDTLKELRNGPLPLKRPSASIPSRNG